MYVNAKKKYWTGRIDSLTNESMFRLHQIVQPVDLTTFKEKQSQNSFGIIGYKSDEGIRRNQGRIGASDGPDRVRKALSSMPSYLSSEQRLFDFGNICCEREALEEAQYELGKAVEKMLQLNIYPLIVGGGHDVAYGHYLGAVSQLSPGSTLGILNIDAHFDMRSYESGPSSGTMFKQILDENDHCHYMCVGIQRTGNTRHLFDRATTYGCQYILEEDINSSHFEAVLGQIRGFIEKHDYAMLTLCCDVLTSSDAPGVSAPSPLGMNPKLVKAILKQVASYDHVLGFDIAEISPPLDENDRTVKLGAHLIEEVLQARLST